MDGAPSTPAEMNALQPPQPVQHTPHGPALMPAGGAGAQLDAAMAALHEARVQFQRTEDIVAHGRPADVAEIHRLRGELAVKEAENAQLATENARLVASNTDSENKARELEIRLHETQHAAAAYVDRARVEAAALQAENANLRNMMAATAASFNSFLQGNPAAQVDALVPLPVTPPAEPVVPERRISPAPSEPPVIEERSSEPAARAQRDSRSPSLPPPAKLAEPRSKPEQTARESRSPSAAIVWDLTGDDDDDAQSNGSPQSTTQTLARGPTEIIESVLREVHANDPATLKVRLRQLRARGAVRNAISNKWRLLRGDASLSDERKQEIYIARFKATFPGLWLRYDPAADTQETERERAARESLEERGVIRTAAPSAAAGTPNTSSDPAGAGAAKRRRAASSERHNEVANSSDAEEPGVEESSEDEESDGEFLPAREDGEEDEGEERRKRARREPSREY